MLAAVIRIRLHQNNLLRGARHQPMSVLVARCTVVDLGLLVVWQSSQMGAQYSKNGRHSPFINESQVSK